MTLLPLDLILVVGLSAATFILGLKVWWRNKWAEGNALYALIAITLAFWSITDWFVRLQASALPDQVFVWRMVFYLSTCLGAGLATQAVVYLARIAQTRRIVRMYLLGLLAFSLMLMGLAARYFWPDFVSAPPFITAGSILALALYAAAVYFIATDLYPLLHSTLATELEQRRATYGLMILMPFALSGALQFVVGPLPFSWFIPVLESWFLFFSLVSFIRASFLDVAFSATESFLVILIAYAVVMTLHSDSLSEAVVVVLGACLTGLFAVIANRSVRGERAKREFLEKVNHEMKMIEEAKNDFLDMVAHQLRGPLGGIRAMASMLSQGDMGKLPEKAQKNTELIENTATRLLTLADFYLNASRLQVGKFMSICERVDVRREIRKIVEELAAMALAKKLEVIVDVNENVPSLLELDIEVLQNVLFNLLDNAVKFTQAGSVTIRASLADSTLTITVKDTGPGMTAEEMQGLFQRTTRRVGDRRDHTGTGLGLFIARRLLDAASGTITVASEGLGKGSTFQVTLPVGKM